MIFIYKTNHLYESGSVSVFFAIIMVVLITFLFTIFDYSRLQFIQLEASSNFEAAAEIALSQYEPLLFHQYGIFAGHQGVGVETIFNECLETQFYPDNAKNNTYLLDYIMDESSQSPKLSIMEPESYEFELSYEPFISRGYKYPREQILEFMKLREPYLLLKPFLLNLDVLSKSSRSSSIIEEKNEMLTKFATIEAYKLSLYKLIDGVEIYSDGNWSNLSQTNYVRKFTYDGELDYSFFPINAKYTLEQHVFNYTEFMEELEPLLSSIEGEIEGLLESDPFIYLYTNEISEDGIEVDPILIGVVEKQSTTKSIENLKQFKPMFNEFEDVLTMINGQLQCNRDALELVNDLETLCSANIDEIESYQSRLVNKDNVIESIKVQINNELEGLKSEMSVGGISFNKYDNLPLIKVQLSNNVEALSQSLAYYESMLSTLEDYIYRRYISLEQSAELESEQLQLLNEKMLVFLENDVYVNSPVEMTTVINLANYSSSFISQYESNIIFDYRELDSNKPDENIYEDKEQGLLNLDLLKVFKDAGLINFYPGLNIKEGFLPSHQIMPDLLSVVDFSKMENGVKDVVTSKSISGFDFDVISDLAGDLHETVLINEYCVGMFSNVNKANNPNSKTLNGFKVAEHFLDYETEYILAGYLDEQHNMDIVMSYLYGTRMMLNILHLAMEPTKRGTIMNIATTIAGWWTGGVGAIIIAIVIAGFWALLESVADVFMLVSGERVPIIKTRSSWYSSLDGNIMELFNVGVQRIENDFIIYMEETNDLIDGGLSGIKNIVEQNISASSTEEYEAINGYIDELKKSLVDFGEEVGHGVESFEMEFDFKLNEYIDQELKETLINGRNNNVTNPFTENKSRWISSSILQTIYLEYYNLPREDRNLEALIQAKEDVMEQFGYQVNVYKEGYKSQVSSIYSETINYQMKLLEESVSLMVKEGTKIGRKVIVDKADEIKEEFLSEVGEGLDEASGVEAFIPSFSYEDYLRIFLLLPIVDETTKIARMMDLIQLNTQKVYDDYDMNLVDYYVGVNVKGMVKAKTLFIPSIEENRIKKTWNLEVYDVHKDY